MKALGDAATDLVWLAPASTSLVSLTRAFGVSAFGASPSGTSAWTQLRTDPGAVLLLARVAELLDEPTSPSECIEHPRTLELALELFDRHEQHKQTLIDWSLPGPSRVRQIALQQALLASRLAELTGVDPDQAWCTGLFAPLGWLALCALSPEQVAQSLKPGPREMGWQQRTWGADHTAITRRLGRWWRLPKWLTSVVGNLGLHVELAQRLGAEPRLFQITQLAARLVQDEMPDLDLSIGAGGAELCDMLQLPLDTATRLAEQARTESSLVPTQNALDGSLVVELLRFACNGRRNDETAFVRRLEQDLDQAQAALVEQCQLEGERLEAKKLAAVAELAAGAGHEINNPLAVISGQAQYSLRQLQQLEDVLIEEPELAGLLEPLQQKVSHALETIIGQTHRIHSILTDLMHFARPSSAKPQPVSLTALAQETMLQLSELAQSRKVNLLDVVAIDAGQVLADPVQTRMVLTNLLRNAIEAAPAEGWAGIRFESHIDGLMSIHVEDNGPGPTPLAREHLFDPFFSGRSAGRGRGLGLSAAWRLAKQQGGEVRFAGHTDGVTRFTFTLPFRQVLSLAG